MEESILTEITSYKGGKFKKTNLIQRESSFKDIRDKYQTITVFGISPVTEEVVESTAWIIQGVAVHAAKFSSGNVYHFGSDQVLNETENTIKEIE